MKFWRYYLRWITQPGLEFACGTLFTMYGSFFIGALISPWLLLITMPVGTTAAVHGLWRIDIGK